LSVLILIILYDVMNTDEVLHAKQQRLIKQLRLIEDENEMMMYDPANYRESLDENWSYQHRLVNKLMLTERLKNGRRRGQGRNQENPVT